MPVPAPEASEPAPAGDGSPYVTPLVRKLAMENSVDLAAVKGTGVGGRIRKQDVLAAAQAKQAPSATAPLPPGAGQPPRRGRRRPLLPARIPLAHLVRTTQKANLDPSDHREEDQGSLCRPRLKLTQTHEVDMTKIVGLRARAKKEFAEREGVNLTYLPFIARAVIDALKAHPNVNASYNEGTGEITYYDAEHLGFAVDTEQGLLSPVVHNAGDLSLAAFARAINDIAGRARSGGLKPDELSGGTFTITNIGSQGALFDTPILSPPQAAMLGTGAIVNGPVIVDEMGNESIGVRSVCYLPLTYDHRLIDGADAGRFVTTIKRRWKRCLRSRTRAVAVARKPRATEPRTIAIAGSSGLIGSALVCAACEWTSRRAHARRGAANSDELEWHPDDDDFDPDDLAGVDAVVNLAASGSAIGAGPGRSSRACETAG